MKIDLVMPKMGESLTEGTIVKWLKKEGDRVERDEMILEISTDKVDTEVPAPNAGILSRILANENETVEVGKVIAVIDTAGSENIISEGTPIQQTPREESRIIEENAKPEPPVNAASIKSNGVLTDVVMPKMGESLTEGTIVKWLKKAGDKIERDEMILEISTDKVDTEVPSPVAGILVEVLYNENDVIEVGKVIARIASGESSKAIPISKSDVPNQEIKKVIESNQEQHTKLMTEKQFEPQQIPRAKDGKFYSPLVRAIAEKENITLTELESLNGSGVDSRITKNDVLDYIEKRKSEPAVKPKPEIIQKSVIEPTIPQKRDIAFGPDSEVIPMNRIRQLISEHMVYSKRTSAHVTSVAEADVTGMVKLRENEMNVFLQREGFKLTFTPFFAKAVIDGVHQFPLVNVSVDGLNIIRHRRINLGIATALDDGNLIVPVIRNADDLGITGLARQVFDLSSRARTKKLNPDDIMGGTITITNVGTFGTLFGTPIINQPQTAIFGVGAIKKRPVVMEINGEDHIVVRQMMYVSITYDHRVIDGQLAGQCLAAIVHSLEGMNKDTIKF